MVRGWGWGRVRGGGGGVVGRVTKEIPGGEETLNPKLIGKKREGVPERMAHGPDSA